MTKISSMRAKTFESKFVDQNLKQVQTGVKV